MTRVMLLLAAVLFGCGSPSKPSAPAGGGGFVAATSAPALGGAGGGTVISDTAAPAAGGAVTGGASTVEAPRAIVWPTCPKLAKRTPQANVERLRRSLGRRQAGPIVARPRASYRALDLPNVFWEPSGPALDQARPWLGADAELGSCTGNFGVNVRASKLWRWPDAWTSRDPKYLEGIAVGLYEKATLADPFEGSWPPDDTGSTGAAVLAVMRARGLIAGWITVQSFEGFQRQMQRGPCGFGSTWYDSMFQILPGGNLAVTGPVAGGHQVTARGIDYSTKRVLFETSWGNDFGCEQDGRGGYYWLKFGDVQRLITEGADIDCPYVDPG